jgi:transketolase
LRLTRQDLTRVHAEDFKFFPGKFDLLKSGHDITVFASGGTVYNALAAAFELLSLGINVRVYNVSSIKPVDDEVIFKAGLETKLLVSIEDHSIIGGLGGAISESLSEHGNVAKLCRIGINDEFGESGTPESLYEKHGLSREKISERLVKEWRAITRH